MCAYCSAASQGVARWWTMVKEGRITNEEALEILENSEKTYVPQGHTFTLYDLDTTFPVYLGVLGAALVLYALVALIFNSLPRSRRG